MRIDNKKIITICAVFFMVCFVLFLLFRKDGAEEKQISKSEIVNEVDFFASRIIDKYRFKNDYSGLHEQDNDLVAGDENGDPLGYGAKSFMIVANNVDEKRCLNFLDAKLDKDLSLVFIDINSQRLYWGNGLPIENKKDMCKDINKIIWNFL